MACFYEGSCIFQSQKKKKSWVRKTSEIFECLSCQAWWKTAGSLCPLHILQFTVLVKADKENLVSSVEKKKHLKLPLGSFLKATCSVDFGTNTWTFLQVTDFQRGPGCSLPGPMGENSKAGILGTLQTCVAQPCSPLPACQELCCSSGSHASHIPPAEPSLALRNNKNPMVLFCVLLAGN